jgi:hypothetical protein
VALAVSALPATAAPACQPATKAAGRATPVGTTACDGVRPGGSYVSGSEMCSFAFVFTGSDRRRYVATAGHCAFDPDPDRTTGRTQSWRPGSGPEVTDENGHRIGRFAYATLVGQFRDFALIRLDPGVKVDPQMCHFGGPTGLNTTVANADLLVHHYGQGVGFDYVPARTGEMFFGLYRPDYVYFYGAGSVGDSGAPVTDEDGNAIGVITDLTTPFTGNLGVNRLAQHLADAERALRIRLTLQTAPLR